MPPVPQPTSSTSRSRRPRRARSSRSKKMRRGRTTQKWWSWSAAKVRYALSSIRSGLQRRDHDQLVARIHVDAAPAQEPQGLEQQAPEPPEPRRPFGDEAERHVFAGVGGAAVLDGEAAVVEQPGDGGGVEV